MRFTWRKIGLIFLLDLGAIMWFISTAANVASENPGMPTLTREAARAPKGETISLTIDPGVDYCLARVIPITFTWEYSSTTLVPISGTFMIISSSQIVVWTESITSFFYIGGHYFGQRSFLPNTFASGLYNARILIYDGSPLPREASIPFQVTGGDLKIFKYEDINGSGGDVPDSGENPIQGVDVDLVGQRCGYRANGVTSSSGWVNFTSIPSDTYRVTETVPSGMRPTRGITQSVQVVANATRVITFANQLSIPYLCGFKREKDTNRGLAGWNIRAQWLDGTGPTLQTFTDSSGYYEFRNLQRGRWRVWEEVSAQQIEVGWETVPNNASGINRYITISSGEGCAQVSDFVNWIPPFYAKGIAVDPQTHYVYVTNSATGYVHVASSPNPLPVPPPGPTSLLTELTRIQVGSQPWGVAVNPGPGSSSIQHPITRRLADWSFPLFLPFISAPVRQASQSSSKVYVANYGGDSITVINASTNSVLKYIATQPYGGQPTFISVITQTNTLYVPLHASGKLAVIDGNSDTIVKVLDVGTGVFGVAADGLHNRVYVSSRDSLWVSIVDTTSNTVLTETIRISPEDRSQVNIPYVLATDPLLDDGRLFVIVDPIPPKATSDNPDHVWMYPMPTFNPITSIQVGNGGPDGGTGIGINPRTHNIFVTNNNDWGINSPGKTVSKFSGATLAPVTTLTQAYDKRLFFSPVSVGVDPDYGYIYIGTTGMKLKDGISAAVLLVIDQ
jgi:YVTN family beta-propeller protein